MLIALHLGGRAAKAILRHWRSRHSWQAIPAFYFCYQYLRAFCARRNSEPWPFRQKMRAMQAAPIRHRLICRIPATDSNWKSHKSPLF